MSDTEVTTATIKMRLENRGCSIPPEINSYVPLPHVFLLVFIPHSYFFPLLLIQQTTLKFLFQGKDNCGWKEQLTPGILHVSFSNHWHRKLFVRTFVPYYRQQSLFFLVHFPNNFQRWEEERDSSGWKASWLHAFLCAVWSCLKMPCSTQCTMSTSTETAHSGGVKSNFARNELHIPPACHSCIPPAAWPSLRSPVNPLENPSRGTEQVRPWSWGWHGWI